MAWCMWLLASCGGKDRTSAQDQEKVFAKSAILAARPGAVDGPLLRERKAHIESILKSTRPVQLLGSNDVTFWGAHGIALSGEVFTQKLYEKDSGKPYLNEIFNVYPARPQELPQGTAAGSVYRVEMYNFALNLTTVALVDVPRRLVLSVNE